MDKIRIDSSRALYESNPYARSNFSSYEEYFEWAEKVNELIIRCETLAMNPNTKTISVKTIDPATKKVLSTRYFTKAEYEEYKKDPERFPSELLKNIENIEEKDYR